MLDRPVHAWFVTPCVVNHADAGPVDEYGDHPLANVTTSNEHCYLAQSVRTEAALTGIERERWQVYLPPTVVIDANDTIDIAGVLYQVYGPPWPVVDPLTAVVDHIEATLERAV